MPTRTVTGTVLRPSGAAWAGGKITFYLLDPFETSWGVYPAAAYEVTMDSMIVCNFVDNGEGWTIEVPPFALAA